jgi:uncharacterized membrane protein
MARNKTIERLRQDINVWYADGVIEKAAHERLQERYESQRFGWAGVIKYIGISGGLLAFFGILGMITAMTESGPIAALFLGGVGGGFTYWGVRLSGDFRNRYCVSAKVVLTLGVVLWTSAIGIFTSSIGIEEENAVVATGLVSLPISFFLAYRNRNQYLLIISLLGFYHWMGSWSGMLGRSAYAFSVLVPQVMAIVAFVGVAIGVYHEWRLYPKTGRFYQAWESIGLFYLNMSLLILSIWGSDQTLPLIWIITFTTVTLVQIVLGAMWQNSIFRGFGITFFAINIFTRYHELFWNELDLGRYLLAGGGMLLFLGVCTEIVVQRLHRQGGVK